MIHFLTGLLQCPVVLEKLAQALLWWDFYPILPDECESLTSVNFCFFPQIPSVIEWAAAAALFSLAVCWKSASHHNVPTSRLHCWGLMGSMVSPSNTVNNDIQPRVTDPPRSSLALSEANLLFLALCEAPRKRPFTLLSEMSWFMSFRRVVSKVQSGEGVKVLGDFFAFTCATKLMVKTFYRPSVQPQSADISLGAGLLSNHRFQLFLGFVPLRCAIRFYYTEVILTELCCSSTSSHGNIWLGCLLQVRRFKHVRRGGGPVTPPSCLGFPQKRPSKRTDLIVNSFIAPTLRRICSAAASLPTVMQYKQCFYD